MAVQSLETLKAATTKRIPIRRNPGVLPPGSILIKIPNARGPELDPVLTKGIPQIDYGQHIYGYNNIRTNQVVYSLSRQLNVCPSNRFQYTVPQLRTFYLISRLILPPFPH